jgi:hypothetical protein
MIFKKIYPPKLVVSYLIPTKKSAHDHLDQKFFLNMNVTPFAAMLPSLVIFEAVFPRLGFLGLIGEWSNGRLKYLPHLGHIVQR